MQGQLAGCSPQLQLVTVTVTAMAVVAAGRQVHGERAATLGRRLVQGTAAVPLRSGATHRLEGEQVENVRYGDLGTQSVEVDTWHRSPQAVDQDRSVPFSLESGTGTVLLESVRALPTGPGTAEAAGSFERLKDGAQACILDC